VQWRVYFFEDYSETESLFVFKIHHSLADGIGLMLMYSNLVDTPNHEDFPKLTARIGFW
jgi:peptide subunit release factor RF-3